MVFPKDTIGVYLDWRTQEVGIAAALSGDQALIDAYSGGDVYHALARMCGLTDDPDPKHWKNDQPVMRQRMKELQLGINYGMGVPTLAKGLDRHPLIASDNHRKASANASTTSGNGVRGRCSAPCSIGRWRRSLVGRFT